MATEYKRLEDEEEEALAQQQLSGAPSGPSYSSIGSYLDAQGSGGQASPTLAPNSTSSVPQQDLTAQTVSEPAVSQEPVVGDDLMKKMPGLSARPGGGFYDKKPNLGGKSPYEIYLENKKKGI